MIQIGNRPEAVSDEPMDHLVACHDRILARLATLRRVGESLETNTEAALNALHNAIRFFEISGKLHTEDEEESVFPRLRSRLTPEQIAYVESLEAQHREKEAVYQELKSLSAQLASTGITPEGAARFRELTAVLSGLYESHIASENEVLVALGRRVLSPAELAQIREEMKGRRYSS